MYGRSTRATWPSACGAVLQRSAGCSSAGRSCGPGCSAGATACVLMLAAPLLGAGGQSGWRRCTRSARCSLLAAGIGIAWTSGAPGALGWAGGGEVARPGGGRTGRVAVAGRPPSAAPACLCACPATRRRIGRCPCTPITDPDDDRLGRLPRADRRGAAHPLGAAARAVHRRGGAGAAAGAAGRLPAAVLPRSTPSGSTRSPTSAARRSTRPRRRCWRRSPASTCTAACSPRSTGGRCRRRRGARRPRRVAILEDVNNHTNIGAVFRGAAALGIDARAAVADLRRPALPAQRAGQHGRGVRGAVRHGSSPGRAALAAVRDAGFTVLALTPGAGRGADAAARRRRSGTGRRCCSARRARACPGRRWTPATYGWRSRCAGASTRSTWPPPPRSRSGSWAATTRG